MDTNKSLEELQKENELLKNQLLKLQIAQQEQKPQKAQTDEVNKLISMISPDVKFGLKTYVRLQIIGAIFVFIFFIVFFIMFYRL